MEFRPDLVIEEDERVYRPAEDSHLLLRAAVVNEGERVLDVGTGTGFLALHAAKFGPVVATDINPHAVSLAHQNAKRNGADVSFVRADLFGGLRGRFNVVLFNPPYLPVEDDDWLGRAWSGGPSGDKVLRRFLSTVPSHMAEDGRAYLLLSTHNATAWREARKSFRMREIEEEPLFFERLWAVELRHRLP